MADYYDTANKKATDFIIGFLLNIGIGAAYFFGFYLLFTLIGLLNIPQTRIVSTIVSVFMIILVLATEVFLIWRFFRKGRRYFAIGMIASAVLPLLVTGFCSALIIGLSGI